MSTLRSLALRATTALAVLAAAAPAAHAQACTTGTLADYLGLAGGCQLGGLTFSGFGFTPTFGVPINATQTAAAASSILLTPYAMSVGGGVSLVGFTFDGFAASVTANAASVRAIGGLADVALTFDVAGAPGALLGGGYVYSLAAAAGNATAGAAASFRIGNLGPSNCYASAATINTLVNGNPASDASGAGGFCANGPIDGASVRLGVAANANALGVFRMTRTADAEASIQNVQLLAYDAVPTSTTPEPATIALVAGGLLALGGVARRRRA